MSAHGETIEARGQASRPPPPPRVSARERVRHSAAPLPRLSLPPAVRVPVLPQVTFVLEASVQTEIASSVESAVPMVFVTVGTMIIYSITFLFTQVTLAATYCCPRLRPHTAALSESHACGHILLPSRSHRSECPGVTLGMLSSAPPQCPFLE